MKIADYIRRAEKMTNVDAILIDEYGDLRVGAIKELPNDLSQLIKIDFSLDNQDDEAEQEEILAEIYDNTKPLYAVRVDFENDTNNNEQYVIYLLQ